MPQGKKGGWSSGFARGLHAFDSLRLLGRRTTQTRLPADVITVRTVCYNNDQNTFMQSQASMWVGGGVDVCASQKRSDMVKTVAAKKQLSAAIGSAADEHGGGTKRASVGGELGGGREGAFDVCLLAVVVDQAGCCGIVHAGAQRLVQHGW